MSRLRLTALLALLVLPLSAPAAAAESASGNVAVTAQFSARTSLRVSTQVLEFSVAHPGEPATAGLDFSAGARTRSGGEVVLTVEAARDPEGPGGAADVERAITFSGDVEGTRDGRLLTEPSVAARWQGSGRRQGRLTFALRAGAPGVYSVPVRLVLSAP